MLGVHALAGFFFVEQPAGRTRNRTPMNPALQLPDREGGQLRGWPAAKTLAFPHGRATATSGFQTSQATVFPQPNGIGQRSGQRRPTPGCSSLPHASPIEAARCSDTETEAARS